MLELQRADLSVPLPHDDNQGGEEPLDDEVVGQLASASDLSVQSFQDLPAAGIGVDLDEALSAERLENVVPFGSCMHGALQQHPSSFAERLSQSSSAGTGVFRSSQATPCSPSRFAARQAASSSS